MAEGPRLDGATEQLLEDVRLRFGLKRRAVNVLRVMLAGADEEHRCRFSEAELAEAAGCARVTASRGVEDLERAGVVTGHGLARGGRPKMYTIRRDVIGGEVSLPDGTTQRTLCRLEARTTKAKPRYRIERREAEDGRRETVLRPVEGQVSALNTSPCERAQLGQVSALTPATERAQLEPKTGKSRGSGGERARGERAHPAPYMTHDYETHDHHEVMRSGDLPGDELPPEANARSGTQGRRRCFGVRVTRRDVSSLAAIERLYRRFLAGFREADSEENWLGFVAACCQVRDYRSEKHPRGYSDDQLGGTLHGMCFALAWRTRDSPGSGPRPKYSIPEKAFDAARKLIRDAQRPPEPARAGTARTRGDERDRQLRELRAFRGEDGDGISQEKDGEQ